MSSLISSYIIHPVVRQARRFSSSPPDNTAERNTARRSSSPADNDHAAARRQGGHEEGGEDEQDGDIFETSTIPATHRIPAIARQNGLQGLIPLDDVRTNYVFYSSPVSSPSGAEGRTAPATESVQSPQDAAVSSLRSMSLDPTPSQSSNPSFHASERLRNNTETSSRMSFETGRSSEQASIRSRAGSVASSILLGYLPADDGMKDLREKIHQIRDMALSNEEKARQMHELMVADFKALKGLHATGDATFVGSGGRKVSDRPRSGHSSVMSGSRRTTSTDSMSSMHDLASAFNLTPGDLEPSYSPPSPPPETEEYIAQEHDGATVNEEDVVLGCRHYRRNVKVQCVDCQRWYTCRHCHDAVENHLLIRKSIQHMLCMHCGYPQKAAEYCRQCDEQTAVYYCDICKLWDNDSRRRIYHCPDCGICRRGEGLGKDYVHCKKCNVCISISWAASHRCVERATECDCPICGEYLFTSSTSVVAMKCGHYIHRACYDEYMHTSYKCPICNRSAVNMELQWRKLDAHIVNQPMPDGWREAKAWVFCNDCMGKSLTGYHWLGNKCATCDSYNTTEIKVVNGPAGFGAAADDEQLREITGDQTEENFRPTGPATTSAAVYDQSFQPAAPLEAPFPNAMARSASPNLVTSSRPAEAMRPPPLEPVQNEALPYSPSLTDTTVVGSPHSRGHSHASATREAARNDAEVDMADSIEDELTFWGEGISPPRWSMPSIPRGLSPGGAWTNSRFFPLWDTNSEVAERADDVDVHGNGDEDSDRSMTETDAEEWTEDEGEEDDEMDLIGHR